MSRHSYRIGSLLVLLLLINTLPTAPATDGEIVPREPTGTRGTIVVNASGGGDYTRIQWAIDNASEGDTVYVEEGTYEENLVINKTISLVSVGREFVTIMGNGNDDVVEIMANWVNLTGFHIMNDLDEDMETGGSGICLNANYDPKYHYYHVRDNYCRIENNSCVGFNCGIYVEYSNGNIIKNNILTYNQYGISEHGDGNFIKKNDCSHNKIGIELLGADDSEIINNTCNSNSRDGIKLEDSSGNNITGNICNNNGDMGISIGTAKQWECWYNRCNMNTCSNNTNGIRIRGDSDYNEIVDNLCDSNELYGISLFGLEVEKTWYPGSYITYSPENTLVENNSFNENSIGLFFKFSNLNEITNNTFILNREYSIHIGVDSHDNVIHHNDFIIDISSGNQAFDDGSDNTWDDGRGGNYWSDYSVRYPDAVWMGDVWDTPYEIEGSESPKDRFPLVEPVNKFSPIALAGPDATIILGETVIFNGSVSLGYPSISNYTWSFVYMDTTMHLYGPFQSFTFYITGIHQVTLIVTDSIGRKDVDTMTITVIDNVAPIAYAGPDDTIERLQTYRFNGSLSSDNVGIASYLWSFYYEPEWITVHGIFPAFTFSDVGVYHIALTVTDIAGNQANDTMVLTVLYRDTDKYVIVDSSGKGDYRRIQDGIENVSVGGTVYVREGIYRENIVIDKQIDLIGAGIHNTTIEGPWTEDYGVIQINTNWVNVSGFKISSQYGHLSGITLLNASNCQIFENYITECCYGIHLLGSSHNRIWNNICQNNSQGMNVSGSSNIIHDNTCNYNGVGIRIVDFAGNSIVTSNNCSMNDWVGITLIGNSNNLTNNVCNDNCRGIYVYYSESNRVLFNILENNQDYNIKLEESYKNDIHHNNFVLESQTGIQAFNNCADNSWDDGSEGNYWSDYTARYPNAVKTGNTWDTPYEIDGGNSRDDHPLYSPNVYVPIIPTAVAGQDVEIELNGTVVFDSSGSLDDMGIINYTWTFLYDGKQITLTGATPLFRFEISGTYVVTLTVTDAQGNTGTDVIYVEVLPKKIIPTSDDVDPVDDDGEDTEKGGGVAVWIWLMGAFLFMGIIVILVIFLRRNKSGEEDMSGEDELGRVGKDDGADNDG